MHLPITIFDSILRDRDRSPPPLAQCYNSESIRRRRPYGARLEPEL
jgi:hypothetical protein